MKTVMMFVVVMMIYNNSPEKLYIAETVGKCRKIDAIHAIDWFSIHFNRNGLQFIDGYVREERVSVKKYNEHCCIDSFSGAIIYEDQMLILPNLHQLNSCTFGGKDE